jgi:membrane protease YdiL (CAAX protease family)
MEIESMPRRDALLLAISFEGGLVLLALLLGWLFGEPPLQRVYWTADDLGMGIAATGPLLLGFWVCLRWPVRPLRRIKQFSEEFIRPFFKACSVLDLAVIAVVAGCGEEMLFRGVVQASIDRWLGVGYGLAIASILFGLLHCITPTYALLAAVVGVYFGVLVMRTDNLLVVIVPHALYDFVALVVLVRGPLPQAPELADLPPAP